MEKTPSGSIKVDELTLETSIKGVFAGVDVVTGAANVISAVAQGKQAARCLQCGFTMPCVVFKPVDPHIQVIPWDPIRALELWQKRQLHEGEPLPDIFVDISDVTEAPVDIVGRNKLVLKAKNSEEL